MEYPLNYQENWDYLRAKIKELRRLKGLSISELALRADMDRPNLSEIESGESKNLYFSTLCKIALGLDVPLSELVK